MKKVIAAILVALFTAALVPTTSEASTNANYSNAVYQGNNLRILTSAFNATISDGEIDDIDAEYDELSSEIKKTEKLIGKVSGSKNRKALNEKYVVPAKIARERVIYEVSQNRLLFVLFDEFHRNDFEALEKDYAKLQRLKKRAIEIKKAGGYQALPSSVNEELEYYDQWVKDKFTFARLEDKSVFSGTDTQYVTPENFTSNTRMTYDNGIVKHDGGEITHVFWLDGQYTSFEGQFVLGDYFNSSPTYEHAGYVNIYADGEYVGGTGWVSSLTTEPVPLNIDLRGVNLLTVEWSSRYGNAAIVNTRLNR